MSRTFRSSFAFIPGLFIVLVVHAQGDLCSSSYLLVDPGVYIADGPTAGGGASMADATNSDWYSFDPSFPGFITVASCIDGGADTRVHVHTGSCGTLTTLGSDDDGCPFGYPPGNSLLANIAVTPGNLYFIEFDDRWSGSGFSWELMLHNCPIPVPSFFVTDDSIAVSWDPLAPGATFTVELGPAGFTPGTGTLVTGVVGIDGPPVGFSGLTLDTQYEIYVGMDCGGEAAPDLGPWPVTTLATPPPVNTFCTDALPIACGMTVTGETTMALPSTGPTCASAEIQAPGLWYGFTGSSEDVTLSTCGTADYDTRISVFTGPCDALVCAAGNDDGTDCGTTSKLTFFAQAGSNYRVLVHGYNGETGTFDLAMTCAAACSPAISNDDCGDAMVIVPQLIGECVPQDATNVCAYATALPNPPCDPWANIADVWFSFNSGWNADHTLTIIAGSAPAMNVAIYEACGDLTYVDCFVPATGPIDLTGLDLNTDYFVRVWNGGFATSGTFTICDEADLDNAIPEDASAVLRIHPIPASDMLSIDGLPTDALEIWIGDPQGRIVLRQPASRTIDVASLAPGTYVLQVIGDRSRVSRRIVKE